VKSHSGTTPAIINAKITIIATIKNETIELIPPIIFILKISHTVDFVKRPVAF
jgi:hypothetical protein